MKLSTVQNLALHSAEPSPYVVPSELIGVWGLPGSVAQATTLGVVDTTPLKPRYNSRGASTLPRRAPRLPLPAIEMKIEGDEGTEEHAFSLCAAAQSLVAHASLGGDVDVAYCERLLDSVARARARFE